MNAEGQQTTSNRPQSGWAHPTLHMLARKNVPAGLMFIALAALGSWVSRTYPVGTALRMGTGYMPRLLCWILMGLGAVVLVQGIREAYGGRIAASALFMIVALPAIRSKREEAFQEP